jgi:hypothetical protein
MAVKRVAARTGLVSELDRPMALDQLARKLCHGFGRVPDHAPVTDLAVPPRLGDRHRDAGLVDVQADVGVELRHRSVLLCRAHELHQQPLRRWSQLDVRADRPSAEHGHATNLFVGSAGGGKSAAIAYTLIQTAKLNGVDPQAWLTSVLGRIADHKYKCYQHERSRN